ncbi:hypothetical protein LTR85_007545 [Meristemomyces frigidus]|nr:hypothetical protein LTR85_007545 [Meristemomyces frigidus]
MASSLKSIYHRQLPDAPSLLIVYVKNATPNKEDEYGCDINEFFRGSPGFASIDCQALLYQYPTHINDDFRWQDLLDSSFQLLEQLYSFCGPSGRSVRPLVFIGEGLGGLVIKQAFWKAREQLYRYRDLLEQVSGVVYLVTPHLGQDEDNTASKLGTILKQYSKPAGQRAVTKELLKPYQLCSLHFEELGLNIPILSTFETSESRSRGSRLTSRKSPLVVDRNFACTNAIREELLGLDSPLRQILEPKIASGTRTRILTFILATYEEGRQRIMESMQQSQSDMIRIPTINTPTPAPSLMEGPTAPDSHRQSSSSSRDLLMVTPPHSSTPVSGIGTDSSYELIDSMAGLSTNPRHIRLPCYFTKPHARNREYFPRPNVLAQIETALVRSQGNAEDSLGQSLNTFVLCGMGGLGKTEIAMEFVFAHRQDFDAVFIFHADQASTLAEEYTQAAVQLGLQHTAAASPQDSRELLKSWLAEPLKAPAQSYQTSSAASGENRLAKWLILFDNADDPEILSDYWPIAGTGSVLVTSRNPMAKTSFFFGDTGHELETMAHTEAADWILSLSVGSKSKEVSDAADVIARRLDGLPLAVIQVTSIIRMRQLGLPEFVELYESDIESAEFQSTRIGNRRGYKHNLASVWALGTLDSGPLTLLGVISLLDPDRIQEELLKTSEPITPGLEYPSNPRDYHRDLTPLLQSSIVQRNSAKAELRVHRLVTDVVRETLQTMGTLWQTFDQAVDLVCALWPFWRVGNSKAGATHNIDRWEQSAKLYPHVARLSRIFSLMKQSTESLRPFERLADLLHEAAWYQFERSNFHEIRPLLDLAEEIYEAQDVERIEKLAILCGLRSSVERWKNNGEAALLHAEASLRLQKLLRARTGVDTMDFSYAYYTMGLAYNLCKLPSKAIPCMDQTMEIRKALPGYKAVDLHGPMHHRGLSLLQQGDFSGCESATLEAKKIWEAANGTNDMASFRPGSIYFTLGSVYARQGRVSESFQWYTRSLTHLIATIGDSHIHTARACCAVAEHHIRRQETREASNLLEQTIRVYKMHPAYKEDLAKAYFLYGRLLADNPTTEPAGSKLLDESASCLDEIHPHVRHSGTELRNEHFYGLGALGLS